MSDASYDSRPDTYAHIEQVRDNLRLAIHDLQRRAQNHDQSKLKDPELPYWDEATPLLASLEYGTPEYYASLERLKPATQHHYAHNDHHPQYYETGIAGMSLMALIEMLCDWDAAGKRMGAERSFEEQMEISRKRFGIGDQLFSILDKTARELGFI